MEKKEAAEVLAFILISMHVIQILIYILMLTDARVLGGIVCIPVGILMLSQCRQSGEDNTETSAKYDPLAVVGGAGMLFFGICIMINYIF